VDRFWRELYLRHGSEWRPDAAQEAFVRSIFGEGATPQLVLTDGEPLVGTGLIAVAAPSHSPGHVVYWREHSGELFAGDALQGDGVRLRRGPGVFVQYLDVPAYLATLDRLETLRPEAIYTSHFGVLRGARGLALIGRSRRFVAELHERTRKLLSAEPQRLAEVARGLHCRFGAFAPGMQLHVTTHAHLRLLEADGEATRAPSSDGVERWVRP
jgi:glyoxylase-like metal-dependent hydrolase (beta-lactamase superfamily II)